MKSWYLISAFLYLLPCSISAEFNFIKEEGTRWAVLVSGSSNWFNYRHQADICHAYQILHRNGIADENIIVMMFDDIAHSKLNKRYGSIINKPNGMDVYEGVPKDYTGHDVTPENFLNIITGNSSAMAGIGSGKVVNSGPNDKIFINLVDHGAPGIFAFPSSYLKARDFINALISMYHNTRFKEMVIYLESCESGSMFVTLLPENINVLAMTASSPTQPSFACYYDEFLHVYLGDLFSVSWMEDAETEDTDEETFYQQYEIVLNATEERETTSLYGDLNMDVEILSSFIGNGHQTTAKMHHHKAYYDQLKKESAVEVPDVPLLVLQNSLKGETSTKEIKFYEKEILKLQKNRSFVENIVEKILLNLVSDEGLVKTIMESKSTPLIQEWDCYEPVVHGFHTNCFNLGLNSFALRYVRVFADLCNHGYAASAILASIFEVCTHSEVFGIS